MADIEDSSQNGKENKPRNSKKRKDIKGKRRHFGSEAKEILIVQERCSEEVSGG